MPLPASDEIETGQSILFLGAGFSSLATSLNGLRIKSAFELTSDMLDECGITDKTDYDLDSASEEYLSRFGNSRLSELLHENFHSKSIADSQKLIIAQPWYRIYTTNYDDVIERGCQETGKRYTLMEVTDAVERPQLGITQVIHIYGSIKRLSPKNFQKQFLLTERQRDNSPFLTSSWYRRFSDDVLTAPHVFFVGFSLRDIDLRRLLGLLPTSKLKVFFIEHFKASRATQSRLSKFGSVELIGIKGFASHLGIVRSGQPTTRALTMPGHIEEVIFNPSVSASISGPDIQFLLIAGIFDISKLSQNDVDGLPGSYTVKRSNSSYDRALQSKGIARPVLIHSDIGNGNSIFLMQLAYRYNANGFRIFRFKREPEDISDVLRFFQSIDKKCVVIFDDVVGFKTVCASIISIGNPHILIVASTRSVILESARHLIDARFASQSYSEIDVNLMSPAEVDRLSKFLDENGLYGAYAELDDEEKRKFITKTCGGQFRDVILTLFDTGVLHGRVEAMLDRVNDLGDDAKRLIILGSLLTVAGFQRFGQLYLLADLADYNGSFEELRLQYTEKELDNLMRLEQADISFKSPALAEFILKRVSGASQLLDVAKRALFRINASYSDDTDFKPLSRALLKFSLFGKLFQKAPIYSYLEEFYNECRVLKIANEDPLFLVQRSICNMNAGYFSLSQQYVDTAYALAKRKSSFDTYQIDTHQAKLILSISLREGCSSNLERESYAQSLIDAVIARKNDDLYHPISVMRLYVDIANQWSSRLSINERETLIRLLDRAISHVKGSPPWVGARFLGLHSLKLRLIRAKESVSRLYA